MTDIELVIKIPRKVYKAICDKNALGCDIDDIKNMIRNGTPLPKGHGAIKDVSQIEIPMCEDRSYERWVQVAINATPTIIEAESEEHHD